MEYNLLNQMYRYLTKQETSYEFKEDLYHSYIKLTDKCYFPNKEEIDLNWVRIFCNQMRVLLDRDYNSPMTFLILNDSRHYQKMHQLIDIIELWNTDPEFYGFADYGEFYKVLDAYRKQFNYLKIDIPAAVGKWPRKDRKRSVR